MVSHTHPACTNGILHARLLLAVLNQYWARDRELGTPFFKGISIFEVPHDIHKHLQFAFKKKVAQALINYIKISKNVWFKCVAS